MNSMIARRGVLAGLVATSLLMGCQTVPSAPFSAAQVAALEGNGFRKDGENYFLGLGNKVLFDFDSSALKPETGEMLAELGSTLIVVGIRGASVEGHASAEGREDYNLALSERRAAAVRDALVRGGLDPQSMRVRGQGASDPVASNDTEEGREQNRRVVIIVTPADAIALR
jgi:outer membrane protein OmpA-like peptidoglycan-associated protein